MPISKKDQRRIDDLVDIDFEDIMANPSRLSEYDTRRDEINLNQFKMFPKEARKNLRIKKSTKTKSKRKKKSCGCQ